MPFVTNQEHTASECTAELKKAQALVVKKPGSLIFQAYRTEILQFLQDDELFTLKTVRRVEAFCRNAGRLHRALAEDVGGVGLPPEERGDYEGIGMLPRIVNQGNDQMDVLREIMTMAQPAFQAITDKAKRQAAEGNKGWQPPAAQRLQTLLSIRGNFVEIGRQTAEIDVEIDKVTLELGQEEEEDHEDEHDRVAAALDITPQPGAPDALGHEPPGSVVHPLDVRGRPAGKDDVGLVSPPDRAPDHQ